MASAEGREEKGEEVADLSAAVVGDKVVIHVGGYSRNRFVKVVEKVGKLHVTAGGVKYRIDNGHEAGDSGGRFGIRGRAELATAAMLAEIAEESRRQKLRADLEDISSKFDELDQAQIDRLAAVVSEWKGARKR